MSLRIGVFLSRICEIEKWCGPARFVVATAKRRYQNRNCLGTGEGCIRGCLRPGPAGPAKAKHNRLMVVLRQWSCCFWLQAHCRVSLYRLIIKKYLFIALSYLFMYFLVINTMILSVLAFALLWPPTARPVTRTVTYFWSLCSTNLFWSVVFAHK